MERRFNPWLNQPGEVVEAVSVAFCFSPRGESARGLDALQDASRTRGPMQSRQHFGDAVAERSGDTAFERAGLIVILHPGGAGESGVALRFPPQSMTRHGLPDAGIYR